MASYVTYSSYQISLADPIITFGIIFVVLLAMIGVTSRKTEIRYFDITTTTSLKGVAVLFLLFGHLSMKCLEQKMFFNLGGYWAVIIFLFLSGYGLYRRYRLSDIGCAFWEKRLPRLYIPLWITLILFILLDHVLINLHHPLPEIVLNFLGIHLNDMLTRVNAVAWFVEYIMILYIGYWAVSKASSSENIKLVILFLYGILLSAAVYLTPIRDYHSIWLPYTLVFPVGVLFGRYQENIRDLLPKKIVHQLLLLMPALLSLLLFYTWDHLFAVKAFALFRPLALIIPIVLLAAIYEKMSMQSAFLVFLGEYSYAIYLLHGPFMVKYDFILFREPLYISFFVYFVILIVASYLLTKASTAMNKSLLDSLRK